MDVEIALSRGIPDMENAADSLRAELVAQQSALIGFWDCLTPSDALAGPEGGCNGRRDRLGRPRGVRTRRAGIHLAA